MRLLCVLSLLLFAADAQAGPRVRQVPLPPQAPPVRAAACICGASCVCKPGACPGGCPVASRPDLVTTDGRTIRWTGNAYVFVGSAPATVSGCANGQCPLPRR